MQVVLVTAGYDNTVKFWSVIDSACIASFQHNESHVNRLSISPDKRLLAVAGNPCIRLYDVAAASQLGGALGDKQQPLMVLEGHRNNVTAVGWSLDMKWLYSSSEDGSVRVWDARTGKCQREHQSKHAVNDACLLPSGTELATADSRGCLRVWDLQARECLFEFPLAGDENGYLPVPLQAIASSPDGSELACCNAKGTVHIFSLSDPVVTASGPRKKSYSIKTLFVAHAAYVTRLLYSPDGQWLCTCSADATAKLFSATDYKLAAELKGHSKWVWDAAFSADSAYLITASSDGTLRLWQTSSSSSEAVAVYTGHGKAVSCVALNDIP